MFIKSVIWGETYLRKASKNEHTSIPESLTFQKECSKGS